MDNMTMNPAMEWPDMIELQGGRVTIGARDFYPEEAPLQEVAVAPFALDATPVTNAQFAAFVEATGHITFAEKTPDPTDYPGILPEMIIAGSIVFSPPPPGQAVGPESWWSYVPGAQWRLPYGPAFPQACIADHPVVHIAYADALAFAAWAGKRLPTEVESEFAARGGLDGAPYAWGDELQPAGQSMANVWYSGFPYRHPTITQRPYTMSVTRFPANPYGLFDLIGNVWEWTASDASGPVGNNRCCHTTSAPFATSSTQHKVLKGGSHLCAPNYCRRYRPAAKWFQPVDTTTSHVGFRCARS